MDETIRSQLRLPAALQEKLKAEARRSGRSLNSEIVHRLTQSLSGAHQIDDPDTFIASMADRLAAPENREHLRAILRLVGVPGQRVLE